MTNKIPQGLTREHILAALHDLQTGTSHAFGESTSYDLLHEGARYPPKAVVGLAAGKLLGTALGPYDFKGGLNTICFRTLQKNGFDIVLKADTQPFPEEIDGSEIYTEGAVVQVTVNRYERDQKARAKSVNHHGARCQVCNFDFERIFGPVGSGFIHVHHVVQISEIRATLQR
jgi:5-methylcytosine-specific restriction protein A